MYIMRKKLYYVIHLDSIECLCDSNDPTHATCDFRISVHDMVFEDEPQRRIIMKNAYKLLEEHLLLKHNEKCYECKTCDKKFIRIKDVIKKRHNCSYKKTKLKKRLDKYFITVLANLILGYIE